MILYFADRGLNILGMVSTNLPKGAYIEEDTKIGDVDTGITSLEVTLRWAETSGLVVRAWTDPGNYVFLKEDKERMECYTIIEATEDNENESTEFYAEDAGLDLLNEICLPFEADRAYSAAWYIQKFTVDSGFSIGLNEISSLTRKLSWDGESTVAERVVSVATQFDAEIEYSFDFDGYQIKQKKINILKKRGDDNGVQLRMGQEVSAIRVTTSIANVATALYVTGGTPEDAENPINLVGYNIPSAESEGGNFYIEGGSYLKSKSALRKWSRYLNPAEPNQTYTGHIVKSFNYDTTSKSELCTRAIKELKKLSEAEQNFEIDIIEWPANVNLGDVVTVVDKENDTIVSARVLKIESSATLQQVTATLGDFFIKYDKLSVDIHAAIQQAMNSTDWLDEQGLIDKALIASSDMLDDRTPGILSQASAAATDIATQKSYNAQLAAQSYTDSQLPVFLQNATAVAVSKADAALNNAVLAASNMFDDRTPGILSQAATAANAYTDAQKIGGRNLALKSNVARTSTEYSVKWYDLSEDWIIGQEYTCTVKGSISAPANGAFRVWMNGSSSSWNAPLTDIGGGLYSATFTPTNINTQTAKTLRIYNTPSGAPAYNAHIDWIKLEKGNKRTDWTPAPEDLQADATTKANNALSSAQTYATTKADAALASAKTDATTKADAALASAKTDATTKADAALASAKTDATTKANNALNSAKEYTDSQEVGGRNIILNSDTVITSRSYLLKRYSMAEGLVANQEYTITVKATYTDGYLMTYTREGNSQLGTLQDIGGGLYSWTGRTGSNFANYPEKAADVTVYHFPRAADNIYTQVRIDWIKCEKGNKRTDWSPAPEDLKSYTDTKITQATPSIIEQAKNNAVQMINNANRGYVTFVYDNDSGLLSEILITNSANPAQATKFWRWNSAGLAYTSNGGSSYKVAITMDGAISADFITTGQLLVNRIKLYQDMTVYTSSTGTTAGGKIGYGAGQTDIESTQGIHMLSSNSNSEVIVTTAGARMTNKHSSGNASAWCSNGRAALRSGASNELYVSSTGAHVNCKLTATAGIELGSNNADSVVNGSSVRMFGKNGQQLLFDYDGVNNSAIVGYMGSGTHAYLAAWNNAVKLIAGSGSAPKSLWLNSSSAGCEANFNVNGMLSNSGAVNLGKAGENITFNCSKLDIYDANKAELHFDNQGAGNVRRAVIGVFATGQPESKFEAVATNAKMWAGGESIYLSASSAGCTRSFNTGSDRRIKADISYDVNEAVKALDQLAVCRFRYKTAGNKSYGLIAQEVQEIYPELVSTYLDANEEERLSLDYTAISMLAVAKVQEQDREIKALKAEVAELKDMINKLTEVMQG